MKGPHFSFQKRTSFIPTFVSQLLKIFLILISIPLFFSCKNAEKELTGEELQKEKDAILAVIQKETTSFFARDYQSWQSTFAQTDYAFQGWSNKDGTFDASVGWDNIDKVVGSYIHENPVPDSSQRRVERKNIMYKFYGHNVAFLTWDQFNSDKGENMYLHSKETRVMEKINGQWKIVQVAAFWDYVHPISGDKLKDIQRMDDESRGKGKL